MAMKVAFDETFRQGFDVLSPKILSEWSKVDPVELEASRGELANVVEIVARTTERAPSEIEAKLRAMAEPEAKPADEGAPKSAEAKSTEAKSGSLSDKLHDAAKQMDQVVSAVRRFEAFAAQEAKRVKGDVLPAAETKIKNNLWTSLFIALGLGFLLGLLVRGRGRS
jgi:ElaB/YqjD/DUF883 family membrane-anchored ribosome-binding protein